MLGLYRAPEAVEILTPQISVEFPVKTNWWRDELLEKYTALSALIRIGNPSIKGIYGYVKANTLAQDGGELTDEQLHLFAYALRQIDGQEVGLERLEREIASTNDQRRKSLLALLEVYKLNESEIPLYKALFPERERIIAELRAMKPMSIEEEEKGAWASEDATLVAKVTKVSTEKQVTFPEQSLKSLFDFVQAELNKPNRELNFNYEDEGRLNFAVELLGKYRSREAVKFLVDHVSLRTHGLSLSLMRFDGFPAVRALIQIGNPSVQEILRRMKPTYQDEAEYPERDLHLFAYIIREVDGHEVGLFRLQLAAKDATGTHKLNLLNLIDIYQKRESELQIRQIMEAETEARPSAVQ